MNLDVIEQKIASNEMTAVQVFTQMKQHIPSLDRPYLKNRADMVDGHYCIARKHKDGYHEYWNDKAKTWCSAASVFELGKQN